MQKYLRGLRQLNKISKMLQLTRNSGIIILLLTVLKTNFQIKFAINDKQQYAIVICTKYELFIDAPLMRF